MMKQPRRYAVHRGLAALALAAIVPFAALAGDSNSGLPATSGAQPLGALPTVESGPVDVEPPKKELEVESIEKTVFTWWIFRITLTAVLCKQGTSGCDISLP